MSEQATFFDVDPKAALTRKRPARVRAPVALAPEVAAQPIARQGDRVEVAVGQTWEVMLYGKHPHKGTVKAGPNPYPGMPGWWLVDVDYPGQPQRIWMAPGLFARSMEGAQPVDYYKLLGMDQAEAAAAEEILQNGLASDRKFWGRRR